MSPVLNSSRHTAQSDCSDDFHPSLLQLNLFLSLLEENTSLCTLPGILCCPPCFSFLLGFMLPTLLCLLICNLSSNLSLASLAICPSAPSWSSWFKMLLVVKLLLRCLSCPVVYRLKDDLLVVSVQVPRGWRRLRRAYKAPESIPAMVTTP